MPEVLSSRILCLPCSHLFTSNSSNKSSSVLGFSSSSPKFQSLKCSFNSEFHGRQVVVPEQLINPNSKNPQKFSVQAQMSLSIGRSLKWWEKTLQPNMKEIKSAQDLVDSLLNAGDKLVVVDFFSPGCGGCRALHPKICQFAEMNPDIQFLQVNYEEHKSMCYSLNVHVLPFFRFYKGAQGRLCSFSCTNATIKKFKDALAKHTTSDCRRGPAKGLEEKELLALASNKELSFNYQPKPVPVAAGTTMDPQDQAPVTTKKPQKNTSEEKSLVAAGR